MVYYLSPNDMGIGGRTKILTMMGPIDMPPGSHRLNLNDVPDESDNEPEDFTHYMHLADGRVLKITHPGGVMSDHHAEDNKRTQVIGVYPREHFVED